MLSPKPQRPHFPHLRHLSERERNALSVFDVPPDVLPDGIAQLLLLGLIAAGRDVYCYHAGPDDGGVFNVWLQPLADVRPDHDGRVPVAVWLAHWPELLREFYPGADYRTLCLDVFGVEPAPEGEATI